MFFLLALKEARWNPDKPELEEVKFVLDMCLYVSGLNARTQS